MTTTPRTPELQIGSWLQTGSSIVAELADASGFDWLLIDLEHGCGTEGMVLPQIQVIRHAASIVRVGAPHPTPHTPKKTLQRSDLCKQNNR